MAKITLNDVSNISGNPSTAESNINLNSDAIETAIENTLSRDGTTPNQMNANLDMNSNRILNLPAPTNGSEPLRLQDAGSFIEVTGTLLPSQSGQAGKFLQTDGTDILWASPDTSSEAVIAELLNHVVPVGVIVMWSGSTASVPTGWNLCDGSNVSGFGIVPDLRNRFIVGAGVSYSVGATGGATAVTTSASGSHIPVINDHVLTVDEIPAHSHRAYVWNVLASDGSPDGFGHPVDISIAGEMEPGGGYLAVNADGNRLIENSGTGLGHNHTAQTVSDHTHTAAIVPPYYALAYIIKVTAYTAP